MKKTNTRKATIHRHPGMLPVDEPTIFTDESTHIVMGVQSEEEFFAEVRAQAAAAKRGEPKAAPIRLSFESAEHLLEALTPLRYRLLKLLQKHGAFDSIEELATTAERDRSTVSKDVKVLAGLGLVLVEAVANRGHGRSSSISAAADEIELSLVI